jgi:hypothetical protein
MHGKSITENGLVKKPPQKEEPNCGGEKNYFFNEISAPLLPTGQEAYCLVNGMM